MSTASSSITTSSSSSTQSGYPVTQPASSSGIASTVGGVTASSPTFSATYIQTSSPAGYTTSTVYTTSVYTITSCAPTVTNCPAKLGSVTTEVISLYTTVCPVTATQHTQYPVSSPTGLPGGYDSVTSTLRVSSTFTTYITVQAAQTTYSAVVVPVYPTQPGGGENVAPTSGVSTVSAQPSAASSGQGETTQPSYPMQLTGAGSRMVGPKGVALFVFLCGVMILG